jgi:hypothetical protein
MFFMDVVDLDISHWRSKKDNTGVSFRTIISNVVMCLHLNVTNL